MNLTRNQMTNCFQAKLEINCGGLVILKDINSIDFTEEYSSLYMKKFKMNEILFDKNKYS